MIIALLDVSHIPYVIFNFLILFLKIYLLERENVSRGRGRRERDSSRLPDEHGAQRGLDLTTLRS